jgi:N-acetylmuramoyl-L-alanine amidase
MFGSYNLAKSILNKTSKRTGFKSRGVKEGNFCVIRETKMPAVLVEGGFITNPLERECLRKREYLDKLSKGIAEGINSFIQSH